MILSSVRFCLDSEFEPGKMVNVCACICVHIFTAWIHRDHYAKNLVNVQVLLVHVDSSKIAHYFIDLMFFTYVLFSSRLHFSDY